MEFVNSNGVSARILQKYKNSEYFAICSDGDHTKGHKSLAELVKELIKAGFKSNEKPKEGYISIETVMKEWDNKPMSVEYPGGADAMLQDNGYTLDDAIEFALNGCTFFLE